jgi:hypothetical protein
VNGTANRINKNNMNKENAHLFLPLIQALVDGKIIQHKWINDHWMDMDDDEIEFCADPEVYRIKPEPRTFEMWYYRPTGRMYPWVEDEKQHVESDEWERITVQEVLK